MRREPLLPPLDWSPPDVSVLDPADVVPMSLAKRHFQQEVAIVEMGSLALEFSPRVVALFGGRVSPTAGEALACDKQTCPAGTCPAAACV